MGYRAGIDNLVVGGSKLFLIKKIFSTRFKMDINRVFQIRKRRKVHRVELKNGINLRLDIYKQKEAVKKEFLYQKLAYENNVNVAKIIDIFKVRNKLWRVSEWIEGIRIGDVWNLSKMFEKCGEQIAKLNLVKDPKSNNYLGLGDFSELNLIWTKKEEVYIIDFYVWPRENVDISVVKTIVMGLRMKNRADAFLRGYVKIKSIDKILDILEENNYKWKQFGFEEDDNCLV